MLLFVVLIFTQDTPAQESPVEENNDVPLLGASSGAQDDEATLFEEYQKFMHKFNKNYSSLQELNEKFMTFSNNFKELLKAQDITNQEILASAEVMTEDETIQLGVTEFFDLTEEEYEKQFLNLNVPEEELKLSATPSSDSFITSDNESDHLRHLQSTPKSFDWRDKGVVTSVKNQGSCGSCFSFAVSANLESLYAMKNKKLLDLSEQQIVNCDKLDYGCNGGFMANTYKYIKSAGGMGLESSLKYVARKTTCKNIKKVLTVSGHKFAGSKVDANIAAFLYKTGPLAAAVNANMFKYYKGGVMKYSSSMCSTAVNHAITLVGYGATTAGAKYWIIKNSWGASWGEKGYIRLAWGTCGINTYVLSGVLA
jgi:cathepsin F